MHTALTTAPPINGYHQC